MKKKNLIDVYIDMDLNPCRNLVRSDLGFDECVDRRIIFCKFCIHYLLVNGAGNLPLLEYFFIVDVFDREKTKSFMLNHALFGKKFQNASLIFEIFSTFKFRSSCSMC